MTISVKHKFTSAKSDSADTSLVRPSNWNDEHDLTLETDRLLGRDTASSGAVEEITVSGGLEFTGSGGIQRSALTGDVTASAGSGTTTIANDAVTYAKMQNASTSDVVLGRASAGVGEIEEIACTAAGRALLDDVDAAAQRATLSAAGTGVSNTFTANQIVSVTDNTNAALRITQLGTGNALLVEDSANPDSSPFVIDASGNVVNGSTVPLSTFSNSSITAATQIVGQTNNGVALGIAGFGNAPAIHLARSGGGSVNSYTAVTSGVALGVLRFQGADGTDFSQAAVIAAETSGTFTSTSSPSDLYFSTCPSGSTNVQERMRITSAGRVGINEDAPEYYLDLTADDNVTTTTVLSIQNSARNYGLGLGAYQLTNRNIGGTATTIDYTFDIGGATIFKNSGSENMRITSGGEVYINGTVDRGAYNLQVNGSGVWAAGTYVNGSDFRIKEDISSLDSCLEVVSLLRPVMFRYKSDWSSERQMQPGFIAQEIQSAMIDKPYAEGVVRDGGAYLSVSYQTIIPILTKALQEMLSIVKNLESEVSKLKSVQ